MILLRKESEVCMRVHEYIDEQGVKWITPHRTAEIWNERVIHQYEKSSEYQNYTRYSVIHRKELHNEKDSLILPGGRLYREERIRTIPLRPHPQWQPDRKKVAKAIS